MNLTKPCKRLEPSCRCPFYYILLLYSFLSGTSWHLSEMFFFFFRNPSQNIFLPVNAFVVSQEKGLRTFSWIVSEHEDKQLCGKGTQTCPAWCWHAHPGTAASRVCSKTASFFFNFVWINLSRIVGGFVCLGVKFMDAGSFLVLFGTVFTAYSVHTCT